MRTLAGKRAGTTRPHPLYLIAELLRRNLITREQAQQMGFAEAMPASDTKRALWHELIDALVEDAYRAGVEDGRCSPDPVEVDAMIRAIGPGQATWDGAVAQHQRRLDWMARRSRADAGDPDLLAEFERDATRHTAAMKARDARIMQAAREIGPIGGGNPGTKAYADGWRLWRQHVTDEVWARIWADFGTAARHRLADLDPEQQQTLRRAA